MRTRVKVVRLLVAAGIGAGIALLQYALLLAYMRAAYQGKVSRWVPFVAQFGLFLICYHGLKWAIGRAKNGHDESRRN